VANLQRYINAASSGGNGSTNAVSGGNAAYASISAFDAAEECDLTALVDVTVSSVSGTFEIGESLSFAPSSATGRLLLQTGTDLTYEILTGTPTTADTITGGTSTETCDIDTIDSTGSTMTLDCEGSTDDITPVTVDGWTQSATYFLTIHAVGIHRHVGVWDDSKFLLSTGLSTVGMSVRDEHTIVDGLQIRTNRTSGGSVGLSPELSDGPTKLTNNIIRANGTFTGAHGIQDGGNSLAHIIANNIVMDHGGIGIYLRSLVTGIPVYNNTIVNCGTGIYGRDRGGVAGVVAKNNLVFNCVIEYDDQAGFSSDCEYNASPTVG
jgi:hypothetical protein